MPLMDCDELVARLSVSPSAVVSRHIPGGIYPRGGNRSRRGLPSLTRVSTRKEGRGSGHGSERFPGAAWPSIRRSWPSVRSLSVRVSRGGFWQDPVTSHPSTHRGQGACERAQARGARQMRQAAPPHPHPCLRLSKAGVCDLLSDAMAACMSVASTRHQSHATRE